MQFDDLIIMADLINFGFQTQPMVYA